MVRKKLAVVIAALGTLQAGMVSALGLGEFSLNSALNQPLNAEIQLENANDLDPSQVVVRLATAEDFSNAGIIREYFLTSLKFKVILNDDGTGVIKVTSHDSVVEPYLDFLVEARWPNGRLLREYTVLLDLPVYSDSPATAVQPAAAAITSQPAATVTPAAPATAAAPVAATPSTSSSRQSLVQGDTIAGESYRVQRNDTLWEIASKARPNSETSVQQTMLGIQRMNPNAFINGNINNLKAGYVLRLPTGTEVEDISSGAALSEVASQNQQWKSGKRLAEQPSGAQLDATDSVTDESTAATEQARLSLATSGNSTAGADGVAVDGEGIQALQTELDLAKEGLDKTDRENEELSSRLQDMEAKIATLQRLLELKDDQLAEMQGDLAEDEQATEGSAVYEAETETETGPALEESSPQEVVSEDVVEETLAVEEVVATTPAPIEQPGLLSRLMANPLYMGLGLGSLLVMLLLLKLRKGKEETVDSAEPLMDAPDDDFSLAEDGEQEAEADSGDDVSDQDLAVGDFSAAVDEDVAEEIAAVEEEVTSQAEISPALQPETGDAIAEADIYIAYGRFQQAIDLLSTAIAGAPQRVDLQVKLLEVYLETRDKPGFQQQYASLQALGNDDAIIKVKEMLSTVDGVSDWLDGVGDVSATISDADMDAELIEGTDLIAEPEVVLEDCLDFDDEELDLTVEVEAASVEDEIELELDDEALDELSGGDTMQLTAIDIDALDMDSSSDLELEEIDLDLDLEITTDDELSEAPAVSDDSNTIELEPELEVDTGGEGFELDLDEDFDLDLDDLSVDLADDLEAEFDSGSSVDAAADVELTLEDAPQVDAEVTALDEPELEIDLELETSEIELDPAPEPELEIDLELDTSDVELDLSVLEVEPKVETDPVAAELDGSSVEKAPVADDELDEDGDDFDFLSDADEVATKLDLARAYIDMGDSEGAKDILDEVNQEGSDEQKDEATALLERID